MTLWASAKKRGQNQSIMMAHNIKYSVHNVEIPCGLLIMIPDFHPADQGSTSGMGTFSYLSVRIKLS